MTPKPHSLSRNKSRDRASATVASGRHFWKTSIKLQALSPFTLSSSPPPSLPPLSPLLAPRGFAPFVKLDRLLIDRCVISLFRTSLAGSRAVYLHFARCAFNITGVHVHFHSSFPAHTASGNECTADADEVPGDSAGAADQAALSPYERESTACFRHPPPAAQLQSKTIPLSKPSAGRTRCVAPSCSSVWDFAFVSRRKYEYTYFNIVHLILQKYDRTW